MSDAEVNARIFATMIDLVLVVSRQGDLIRVSPSSYEILGYRPEEMVGHSAKEFLFPPDLDATRQEMRRSRAGKITRHFECRYCHKDGHVITLLWTGVWVDQEQQHIFIGRDVTIRRAEESLRAVRGLLQNISASVDETRALVLERRRDAAAVEVLLMLNSLWAAHLLLGRPALFETYPAAFALPAMLAVSEWYWGIFATVAAVIKASGIAMALRHIGNGIPPISRVIRIIGLSMSAFLWGIFGMSSVLGNPDSLFGFSGVIMSAFAIWSLYRLIRV